MSLYPFFLLSGRLSTWLLKTKSFTYAPGPISSHLFKDFAPGVTFSLHWIFSHLIETSPSLYPIVTVPVSLFSFIANLKRVAMFSVSILSLTHSCQGFALPPYKHYFLEITDDLHIANSGISFHSSSFLMLHPSLEAIDQSCLLETLYSFGFICSFSWPSFYLPGYAFLVFSIGSSPSYKPLKVGCIFGCFLFSLYIHSLVISSSSMALNTIYMRALAKFNSLSPTSLLNKRHHSWHFQSRDRSMGWPPIHFSRIVLIYDC